MKVIIFSVSAGGGHGHAAEAIKSYILENEPGSEVEIIDTLKYINRFIDKVVVGSYLNTIKITPSLFGKLYNFTETDGGIATVSGKVTELLTSKLLPLINKFNPDILLSTHPFSTEMISILKLKYKIDIPIAAILTDFAPHNFWIHPGIDAYVVSNFDMIEEMMARGVEKNIIHDLGIPVMKDFMEPFNREETLKELGFKSDKPTILIMGGSLGMGKISEIYEEIIKTSMDLQILVIAGNNKKLFSELTKLQEHSKKATKILPYTSDVNKYMQACDLLLTKPGGLTITEALICKIPLAIFSPIPGHEEHNAQFLFRHNLAISIENIKKSKIILEDLLNCPSVLKSMKENCQTFAKPNSGNDIYCLMSNLIKNHENTKPSNN
jgi:processive 1,2-diacylglycerol beta-glucosyltransferase